MIRVVELVAQAIQNAMVYLNCLVRRWTNRMVVKLMVEVMLVVIKMNLVLVPGLEMMNREDG
jgi:hypothetical protein